MNEIKLAVLLAVHNIGKYLRRGLESLVSQTLKELESVCAGYGNHLQVDCRAGEKAKISYWGKKDLRGSRP